MRTSGGDQPAGNRLTRRERDLLGLVGRGLTNREIASELGLAEQTVKNYLVVLCEKLGVRNRTQLAIASHSDRSREP